jgi:protein phosphatase
MARSLHSVPHLPDGAVGLRTCQWGDDHLAVDEGCGVFVLASSAHDNSAGPEAPRTAADVCAKHLRSKERLAGIGQREAEERLRGAVLAANRALREASGSATRSNPALAGTHPAVVLTAIFVPDDRAFVAHVGDNRAYLRRGSSVSQLTEDHNRWSQWENSGSMEWASYIKISRWVSKALGRPAFSTLHIDTNLVHLSPQDHLALCSPGLITTLPPEVLKERVRDTPIADLATTLSSLPHAGQAATSTVLVLETAHEHRELDPGEALTPSDPPYVGHLQDRDIYNPYIQTLLRTPVFKGMDPRTREFAELYGTSEIQEVRAGQTLVEQGKPGRGLFVIIDGDFEVLRSGNVVASRRPGDHVGEVSALSREPVPVSATVRARGDGRVLYIERSNLLDCMNRHPNLAVALLWNFLESLGATLARTTELAAQQGHVVDNLANELFVFKQTCDDIRAMLGNLPASH